jgi:MFS family permease
VVSRTTAASTAAPGHWGARRWALLFVLSGNMLLDAIEVSVVLIALPTVGRGLRLTPLDVQWLMSGFALGFAALLLLGPRVSARTGRRPAYLGAMLVFSLASVASGLTDSLALLIAVRVVTGGCAALTAPAGLAIINDTFPEGAQRRRAVSVYSLFGAAGFTVGLLLAGLLVEANWHWIFFFPAPVALVLLLCAGYVLPRAGSEAPARPPRLRLLRDRSLLRAGLCAFSLNGTYQSLLLVLTFQIQQQRGWAPLTTALALLPACVPVALALPFSGRLVARYPSGRLIALGALFPLLGYVLYLAEPGVGHYALVLLPVMLLVEAGFCAAFVALNMSATASVGPEDRGPAVSLYQMCVQLGPGLLLPVVALLLTDAETIRPALALIALVGALGLVISLADRTSARNSQLGGFRK